MKGLMALEPRGRVASGTQPTPRNSLIYRSAASGKWVLCSAFAAGQSGERPAGAGSALASSRLPRPGRHQHRWPWRRAHPSRSSGVRAAPEATSPSWQPCPTSHACRTSPRKQEEVSRCFTGLQQAEVSCYEASPDTVHGSFPAGCRPTRGVWSATESHAAGLAPWGPAHSSGVLFWPPSLSRHRAAAAPGEKPRYIAVLPGRGTREHSHHGGRHPSAREGTCGLHALQPPCPDGRQELLPAPRAGAFRQGDSSLVKTGPTTWLDSLQLLDLSSPSLWAFPLEMKA